MLKKVLVCLAIIFASTLGTHQAKAGDRVRGYYRSIGTYVPMHYRSHADGNFYNNWSTYPNINPYTGRMGTRHAPSSGTAYPSNRSSYSSSRAQSYWNW